MNISFSSLFKTGLLISALALLLSIFACTDTPRIRRTPLIPPPDSGPDEPEIKVLIDKAQSFSVQAEGACTVFDAAGDEDVPEILFETRRGFASRTVKWHRGTVRMQGMENRKIEKIDLVSENEENGIIVNGDLYFGKVRFSSRGTGLTAVNILPAEQYLCGVVLGELGQRAPLEAMKAQSVAARNYALYEYKTRKNKLYHVTKTTKSQVYLPKSNYSSQICEAVNATRGIIMVYDNKLFKSYYSATCGGRTANIEDVWSCLPQVPLTSVTCGFCNDASYYRWQYKLTRHELKRKLHDAGFRLDYIRKVYVPKKGRGISGRVRYVKIEVDKQHHHGTVILTGLHLRKTLNRDGSNIKSTWFSIKEEGSTVLFNGKGFGHGVGMCQEGSMEMARAGYTFKDILMHYYSGISFLRIY